MRLTTTLAALAMSMLSLTSAHAASEPSISLLDGGYSAGTGTLLLGLKVELPGGWHTYWKSPGEGGFAPEVSFEGGGAARPELLYPAPVRIEKDGIRAVGYEGTVVYPVLIKPEDPAKPFDLKAKVRVYACETFCAAFDKTFEVAVDPYARHGTEQAEIASWIAKVPRSKSSITVESPVLEGAGAFRLPVSSSEPLSTPDLFVATPDNSALDVSWKPTGPASGEFLVSPTAPGQTPVTRFEAVVVDGSASVTAALDATPAPQGLGWGLLLTAFLGGLILNVMPCVLPVLSLKLLGLASADARRVRANFAASAFGIVASFVALGAALAALKFAGTQVTWGMQFQNPWFLAATALLVSAFALSMAGAFEFALPSSIGSAMTARTDGNGLGASAAQGFVATLLATPCSAPFVGTAVGFALAGSTSDILAVFAAMGLGMASPYLLLAAAPGLGRIVPKPGRWMSTVKAVLSLGLFATAGWLAMLAAEAFGMPWAVFVLPLLIEPFLFRSVRSGRVLPTLAVIAGVVAMGPAALSLLPSDHGGISWSRFAPGDLGAVAAKGKPVFLYVTADWCMTCKVNERTTFSAPAVIKALNTDVVAMKADWTRPDPAIAAFLAAHGRYGIPFTLVVGADGKELVLPELLSPSAVLDAIKDPKS